MRKTKVYSFSLTKEAHKSLVRRAKKMKVSNSNFLTALILGTDGSSEGKASKH